MKEPNHEATITMLAEQSGVSEDLIRGMMSGDHEAGQHLQMALMSKLNHDYGADYATQIFEFSRSLTNALTKD